MFDEKSCFVDPFYLVGFFIGVLDEWWKISHDECNTSALRRDLAKFIVKNFDFESEIKGIKITLDSN